MAKKRKEIVQYVVQSKDEDYGADYGWEDYSIGFSLRSQAENWWGFSGAGLGVPWLKVRIIKRTGKIIKETVVARKKA